MISQTIALFLKKRAVAVYRANPYDRGGTRPKVWARMAIAVILLKEKYSYSSIAREFKMKHATVFHYEHNHEQMMKYDVEYRNLFQEFIEGVNLRKMKNTDYLEALIKVNQLNKSQLKKLNQLIETHFKWKS